MNNHASGNTARLAVNCFKCSEGCMHLEYGNLMFTFTQQQFLAFSEIIGEARRLLLMEHEATASPETTPVSAPNYVM